MLIFPGFVGRLSMAIRMTNIVVLLIYDYNVGRNTNAYYLFYSCYDYYIYVYYLICIGIVMEPGKKYSTVVEHTFHLSMAALDLDTVKKSTYYEYT